MLKLQMHFYDLAISRDVEAVEYFLLSLPASSKCFCFHKKFNCFYYFQFLLPHPCPMFYKKCFHFWLLQKSNASEFASSFFKVLLQKFNRLRFHISGSELK